MTKDEFEQTYYPKYRTTITAIARKLGLRDDALVQDLEQEGAFALLKLDLSKPRTNPDAFIRQAIKYRMVDFLRQYNPAAHESLDARLEAGQQLEMGEDGELLLRDPEGARVFSWEDETEER